MQFTVASRLGLSSCACFLHLSHQLTKSKLNRSCTKQWVSGTEVGFVLFDSILRGKDAWTLQKLRARFRRTQLYERTGLRLFLKDRAGLGDVGVKRIDDFAIFSFDDAALDLQGERQSAVVESKIFGNEREPLDGFVLREVRGQALDLVVDQSVSARMRGQLGIGGKFQSFISQPRGYRCGVRHDQGGNEFTLIANDHRVQNIRAGLQNVFNRLRR